MIINTKNSFSLNTKNLSYVFHVNDLGVLIHDYFGNKVDKDDIDSQAIQQRISISKGMSVIYQSEIDPEFSLDSAMLEFSFPHKGDYHNTQILFKNDNHGYVFDFCYDHFAINDKPQELENIPSPSNADEELIIYLKDRNENIIVELHYLVFVDCDVIARNIIIRNNEKSELHILKALSFTMDLINKNYELVSLSGGWGNEAQKSVQEIKPTTYMIESFTGSSSNKHNPFFMIKEKSTTYEYGEVIGVNLMYSGNHQEIIELDNYQKLRLMSGINPFCFDYIIKENESFETPFAVLTYSKSGINKASQNMHNFVNRHVISEKWRERPRPICINNWEATMFKFKEKDLLKIAKNASKFGIELFVLDDGWFSRRDSEKAGLGDYNVNKKKLPHGLSHLANKINKLNMKFGLWLEPESVNEDSDLYLAHPEYIIKNATRNPSKGRHQYVLNLADENVQNYIIDNVSTTLKSANIEYVKWDMNRHISDIAYEYGGEFYHRYILGLYRVLKILNSRFENVLFEGCSSGGNRFDLGMLKYFPQIWTSDCTDSYERIRIQSGYLLAYPLSCLSNHITSSLNGQTLRRSPFESRFNVSSFGVLGFELIFSEMEKIDEKRVHIFIDLYKKYRHVFQYGEFYQKGIFGDSMSNYYFLAKNGDIEISMIYNVLQKMNPSDSYLYATNLIDDAKYNIEGVQIYHNIKKFGGLINVLLPIHLNPNGQIVSLVSIQRAIDSEKEKYTVSGSLLNNNGVRLDNEWVGTGINEHVRVMGDFGSRMYIITRENINE